MKILIIDDDSDFRAATRVTLEAAGYDVDEAPSAREGLDAARRTKPDLIVLDIMMESPIEGYSTVHALHADAETADIPIVMVSSIQDDPNTLFPMAGDVPMITPDAYFTKPLDLEPFLDCIRRMIGP
jgi:DNA-binding response OmpR family regulator